MDEKTKSNQFSTSWSYQTSTDPWTAGAMSDVFVVPNLNVMYREVYFVEWDKTTCAVTTEGDGTPPITTTFNIEDTENEPALAFFSRYHVNHVKIPELKAAKANKESQQENCECTVSDTDKVCKYTEADGTEKTTTCLEIMNEIESVKAGIAGWDTALKVENDTLESNTKDASKSINNWFTEYGVKDMYTGNNMQITDQASGLEPPFLPKESLGNEFADDVANEPVKRIQFSGGGNLFSMTMNKEKVWDEVGLSCWEGCNVESETNIKGPGSLNTENYIFGFGTGLNVDLLDLNIHVLHQSTKRKADTTATSIGFVLGDNDPQDEFVVDLFYDEKYGTVIFKTVAGQSKCPHEASTAAIEDPRLLITSRPSQHVFPEEDMVFELEMSNLGVGDESQFVLYAQHRDNDGSLKLLLDGAPFGKSREFTNIRKDSTYKKTLVLQRGPLSYQYSSIDLVLESACEDSSSSVNDLTASIFDETKSITQKLWNVQEDENNFLIKFVEPCPKVEWAGELNRDRHFVVNTNSDDPENLQVTVFNPMHGQSKFHKMTTDRLENVFLYYRELGDLQWSKARTEITKNDGSKDSYTIDFSAEYAYKEESDYGYSSLNWALANKVPEGTYEIRVNSECNQLGGPADMDLYSTPIISGIIDLTRPEQYGRALPLRESVLVGEEMAVVFTEPVRCEAFDLLLTVDSIDVELDRNKFQIVCDGRKVGFQIDLTQIDNVEDWIGMSFSVEMGKIKSANAESKSNVFDMNGNTIEGNVKFEKTFADIDLNQASTLFTVTLNNMNNCSNVSTTMCSDEIKDKITVLLSLSSSDQNRIEVESVSEMEDESTISARIKILPVQGTGRMLRHSQASTINHSVGLFRQLQSAMKKNLKESRMLVGNNAALPNLNNMIVDVSNMQILPDDLDMKVVTTDPEMMEEEVELYHYASMNSKAGMNQLVLNKIERQAMVKEIEKKERGMINEMKEESKSREGAMVDKIERMMKESKEKSQSEVKMLLLELMVVTLASIGISLAAFLTLRRN